VGTRRPTIYGQKVATKLAQELAVAGFTIVSGLAEGIDAAAHRASLEIGGTTVAVLGCGVDVVYPAINVGLYDEIFAKGLLVSEFLPGTKPTKYSFPKRNRIISGLSKGVLFVEGGRKSGAMITVDYALEQGRDVFAVPGKIDNPQAAGTNWIIQHGAKLVQEVNDILEEYNMATPAVEARETSLLEKLNLQQLDEDSRRIVGALIEGEQNIELLSRLLDMDVITLQAKLTQLELKGVVKRRSGKVFGLG
jgi:DNA processing protein